MCYKTSLLEKNDLIRMISRDQNIFIFLVCGGTITSTHGMISSPRNASNMPFFPNNVSCHWSFRPNSVSNGQTWGKTTVFRAERIRLPKYVHEHYTYCASRLIFQSGE